MCTLVLTTALFRTEGRTAVLSQTGYSYIRLYSYLPVSLSLLLSLSLNTPTPTHSNCAYFFQLCIIHPSVVLSNVFLPSPQGSTSGAEALHTHTSLLQVEV